MRCGSFGNLLERRGAVVDLPLGFAGGLFDPDTGLTRFVWRDYDAETGRFTALDPLREKGGDTDYYGYCVDDPVNRVDPLGLMGVLRLLPNGVLASAPKKIRDMLGLDPMSKERVIQEIADKELERGPDNATDKQPTPEQWEGLKKDMEENSVPSPLEAGKRFLRENGWWPF